MHRHPQRYTSLPEKYYHTKKAPTSFDAEASLKTAATYSPTGVQYHRRGRA